MVIQTNKHVNSSKNHDCNQFLSRTVKLTLVQSHGYCKAVLSGISKSYLLSEDLNKERKKKIERLCPSWSLVWIFFPYPIVETNVTIFNSSFFTPFCIGLIIGQNLLIYKGGLYCFDQYLKSAKITKRLMKVHCNLIKGSLVQYRHPSILIY